MGTVGYDSQHLSGISQDFLGKKGKVGAIRGEMKQHMSVIRAVWTGDADGLAGREKDFAEIDKNLDIIENNIDTIARFLEEKNADFSKINYK